MSKKDRNDQIPTPDSYVSIMLDRIGYTQNITGKTILENSCGEGNILVSIVKRYITDARRINLSEEEIRAGLERDIIAFEIDKEQINICRKRLNDICVEKKIPPVRWNIINEDFLRYNFAEKKVSYIVGNPPYITYHDIKEEDRKFLKAHYTVCQKGRFDYSYAFIEASVNALKPSGKMIYLVPFSILRNYYAKELRRYIWKELVDIIDLSGKNVFSGITCSNIFLVIEKGNTASEVLYENFETGERRYIDRRQLNEDGSKWVFHDMSMGKNQFGDHFNVYNSVATLLNDAFLIFPEKQDNVFFYVGDNKIERTACQPAISTRSRKRSGKKQSPYIIFPYIKRKDGVGGYSEEEFQKLYPYTYEYMSQFREKLKKRKADTNAKWYEYGRSQVLNELWQDKLIMPMVITNQAKVYQADKKTVPFAGYFITKKEGSKYTLKDAKQILQDGTFYRYVKEVGTPTTETSYRVSVNDIKKYTFE